MRLFTPAEDSSWSCALDTTRERELVAVIANRLGLAYRVAGDKTFLGHRAADVRPPAKPAPDAPIVAAKMGPHDLHAVVFGGRMVVFGRDGERVWSCEARTKGSYGGPDEVGGDTPPGLYTAGLVTWTRPDEPLRVQHSYGPAFVDLVEQEGQEARRGRAGVGMHGGGSALPDPLAPKQGWAPTLGCIRLQNQDARAWAGKVEAVQRLGGTVWVSVL